MVIIQAAETHLAGSCQVMGITKLCQVLIKGITTLELCLKLCSKGKLKCLQLNINNRLCLFMAAFVIITYII